VVKHIEKVTFKDKQGWLLGKGDCRRRAAKHYCKVQSDRLYSYMYVGVRS